MSRTLALSASLLLLAGLAGCERRFGPAEDQPPAGLRIQPVPGTVVDAEDPLRLPPAASTDPLRMP